MEIDGKGYPIFKNPKDGGFKKSQKGLCRVYRNVEGVLAFEDGYENTAGIKDNELQTIFKDGKLIKEESLQEIRARLNKGAF